MRRLALLTCCVVLVLAMVSTAAGDIEIVDDYVSISRLINVVNYETCQVPGFNPAWTSNDSCDRPGGEDEFVEGLTYIHLNIVTADNTCLLLYSRVDHAIEGERQLEMKLPLGVPITSESVIFEPESDYESLSTYWKANGICVLHHDSSYRVEITRQLKLCNTTQNWEKVLEYAVLDTPSPCCNGRTGDVDGSGQVNVLDLDYLLDFLYRGGPVPECYSEADVNGDSIVDEDDADYLLDYFFYSGPMPVMCP